LSHEEDAVTDPIDQPPSEPPVISTSTGDNGDAGRQVAAERPAPGLDPQGRVRGSRVSGVWIGLIGTALIIFIAQNSRQVPLHFLGWHGQFSLALTILLSAAIGLLLVAIPGSLRIVQLRRALRKNAIQERSWPNDR
jgi:uncharacterized integral membrane protein